VLSRTKSLGYVSECATVKYADLVTAVLLEFKQPGGKEKLAAQLNDASMKSVLSPVVKQRNTRKYCTQPQP
jgi:hypothetical protein